MDFDFTEDQVMLRNLVREFLTDRVTVTHVRKMMDDERGYSDDIYSELIGLGALSFPEEYGGGGLGQIEQAIVLEEMGRVAYPGPYFATITLAANAIAQSGDENAMARYLPDIARADLTATLAFTEESIDWDPSGIA